MDKTVFYNPTNEDIAFLILFNKSGVITTNKLGLLTTIGRASQQSKSDITINSSIVSRLHGEIANVNGKYYYRDLDSTNGTYVNGKLYGRQEIAGQSAVQLDDLNIITFDIKDGEKHHPERVFGLFTTTPIAESNWQKISLSKNIAELCVGRSASSGLQIENDMISEKHASFFCSSNGWAIIDHKSTNGVFLNGKRLNSPRYLNEFDVVRIVDTLFIFLGDAILFSGEDKLDKPVNITEDKPIQKKIESVPVINPRREKPQNNGGLVINIVERSVVQRFKKMILLQDINLSVANGEMVLILGGSGAGKTTFINAVMGYEKADGKIIYSDTDIYEEYEQMKYEIGFVPQQDLLRGSDSVYDTLSNAAEMKLPRKISYEDREERIRQVLEDLGLSREKETLVSKLSGGQRKRLSIAVEFIANPSLFFLDEPDSGVDDIMGRGLMENLRAIADQGKIVMVITHSPERAADLFDKVIVLAKSTKDNCGHLAFYGSTKEAFDFFGVKSFREIVKKINRPDENGEGLSDYFIDKYISYSKG